MGDPLDYQPRPPRKPKGPLFANARYGACSWLVALIAPLAQFGMCIIPNWTSKAEIGMMYRHLIFVIPEVLTAIGLILGVCGALRDRERWIGLFAAVFHLIWFYLIISLYPFAFADGR
jgi:hypothetical protein